MTERRIIHFSTCEHISLNIISEDGISLTETGVALKNEGVISGYDSTFEAALVKLFFLLGHYTDNEEVKVNLLKNIRGEI